MFKRFTRVKIVNKNGLDAGEFTLRLSTLVPYHNIMIRLPDEGLIRLTGTTYNRAWWYCTGSESGSGQCDQPAGGKELGDGKVCHAGTQGRIYF